MSGVSSGSEQERCTGSLRDARLRPVRLPARTLGAGGADEKSAILQSHDLRTVGTTIDRKSSALTSVIVTTVLLKVL